MSRSWVCFLFVVRFTCGCFCLFGRRSSLPSKVPPSLLLEVHCCASYTTRAHHNSDHVVSFVEPLAPVDQESEWLDPVLTLVKKTSPDTDADRRAFLINAYNLWTVYWVIRERRCVLSRGVPDNLQHHANLAGDCSTRSSLLRRHFVWF